MSIHFLARFYKYLPLLFAMLLLSACGPCIDGDYLNNTYVYDTIDVKESANKVVKGSIVIPEKNPNKVEVRFTSTGVVLCEPTVYDHNDLVNGVQLEAGRIVAISLEPYQTEYITEDICQSSQGDMGRYLFSSYNACMKNEGQPYMLLYGPQKGRGSNLSDPFSENAKVVMSDELSNKKAYIYSKYDQEYQKKSQSILDSMINSGVEYNQAQSEYSALKSTLCDTVTAKGVNETCESLGFVANESDSDDEKRRKEYLCSLYLPIKNLSFSYVNGGVCPVICTLDVITDISPDAESVTEDDFEFKMNTSKCLVKTLDEIKNSSVKSIIPGAQLGSLDQYTIEGIAGLLLGQHQVKNTTTYYLQNADNYKVTMSVSCDDDKMGFEYSLQQGNNKPTAWEKVDIQSTGSAFVDMGKDYGKTGQLSYKVTSNLTGDALQGQYLVRAKLPRSFPTIISNFLIKIRDSIVKIVYGEVNIDPNTHDIISIGSDGPIGWIYNNLIRYFVFSIQILISLSIVIFGLFFLMGSIRTPQVEFFMRLIKMIAVLIMFSDASWNFFYSNFFSFFVAGMDELVKVFTYDTITQTEASNVFSIFDQLIGRFFIGETWLMIISIFVTGPLGWLAIILIFCMIRDLFAACIKSTFIYLSSMIVVAMMMAIAPLFFSFLLFGYTSNMFHQWLKIMLMTMMQPVFVFLSISVLGQVVVAIISQIFNFSICTQNVLCLQIPGADFLPSIPLWNQYTPASYNSGFVGMELVADTEMGASFFGLPFDFSAILAASFATLMITKFIDYAVILTETLFGTTYLGLQDTATQMTDSLASTVGMDAASRGKRADKAHQAKLQDYQEDKAEHKSNVRTTRRAGGRGMTDTAGDE